MDRPSTLGPLSRAVSLASPSVPAAAGERGAAAAPASPASGGLCIVDLIDATGSLAPGETAFIVTNLRAAMTALGAAGGVRVRVALDAEMAEAHARYAHVPGTTDVLTFDLRDEAAPASAPLDVDLLICLDEARRQAALRGHAVARELLLYALHGVLHCQGYDDHTEEDSAAMHAREDEILAAIGVGATFGPLAAPEPRTAPAAQVIA